MTTFMELQVFSDSIGDEWNDIDAAGKSFAEFMQDRIVAEYPDVDVNVCYHANLAGCTSDYIYSDDGDDDVIKGHVDQIAEHAWIDFCRSENSTQL